MVTRTDWVSLEVHNEDCFFHLTLRYDNGVVLHMKVARMPYEEFTEYLEVKCGNYFQGLYYKVPNVELENGLVRVRNDKE